ncbi:MAG TPA: hypothetical protein VIY48_05880, partial [Candidatus Paceibacterota bacterium]
MKNLREATSPPVLFVDAQSWWIDGGVMQLDVLGRAARSGLFAAITSLILTGCATYSSSFKVIEENLAAQQYDQALQTLEKQSPSKTELALHALNKGMILRMKRDFAGSNQALEQAKAEM